MEVQTLNDPIEVEAFFGLREVRPVWFIWQGKRRMIRAVTTTWSERDGFLIHRCFAVTDGDTLYELRFEGRALRWHLTCVSVAG